MVGFNRRFAPQVQKVKQLLNGVTGPKVFVMTVNAGAIPADHWTQDIGGGRWAESSARRAILSIFSASWPECL
jgi:predicted dehydrogenase